MHMAEGARLGLRYEYSLLDFDTLSLGAGSLGPVVRAAAEHDFAGLNVTHPFKLAVLDCLDALSPEAIAIGAVNTVVFQHGQAIGHNTDCWGFAESFRRNMAGASLNHVLLVGAGGAGMAVGRALFDLGANSVAVFDLDAGKVSALARSLESQFPTGRAEIVADLRDAVRVSDGIVNATPVGMAKYPGMPVPAELLRSDQWIADVVYFPEETDLLRAAAELGSRTLSGRGMAIFQAVKAFELFTGRRPDPARMSRHFGQEPALQDGPSGLPEGNDQARR